MDNAFSPSWLTVIGVAILLTLIVTIPWIVTLGFFYRGMLAEYRKQQKEKRTGHDTEARR